MVRKARNLCAHRVRKTSKMRSRTVIALIGRSRGEKVIPIGVHTRYVSDGTFVARKMAKKRLIDWLGKPLPMPRSGRDSRGSGGGTDLLHPSIERFQRYLTLHAMPLFPIADLVFESRQ